MKQSYLRDMFSKSVYVSAVWYLLTPCLQLLHLLQLEGSRKTWKKTQMTLNQQIKELSKWILL
jgi:hypothetical protein